MATQAGVRGKATFGWLGCAWIASVGMTVALSWGKASAQTSSAQVGVSVADDSQGQEAVDGAAKVVSARSARLSYAGEGVVLVGRSGANDTFPGQQNMALAQGSRVTATEKGLAEIEFEDGSVVRLTPNSAVNLDFLGMDSSGAGYVTILRVVSGLVYLEMRASTVSRFRVLAGGDSVWPVENATVRVNLDDPPAVLSVLDGRVRVEHVTTPGGDASGPQIIEGYRTDVRAGESLRSDAGDASRYFLSEGIPPESWDHWNEARDQAAADQIASGTAVREGYSGAQGYGWADLDANGDWYGAPGQTPVWQPAEALAAGFDPYGYGSWTYFPGGGYAWASGYAWGWTPYRCGNWQYWDGFGWGWQPDAFCGNLWRFGIGVNVGRRPRGYIPVLPPVRRPIGVHPVVPGPHPWERPPFVRGLRKQDEQGERSVAGVVMQPIRPAGFGYTPRGGSAVGSSLRRDFPVDARTRAAVMGFVGSGVSVPAQPVSVAPAWRAVATRPEPPATNSGGGFRGFFGHKEHPADGAPVRLDSRGNPFIAPANRGNENAVGQGRMQQPAGQPFPGRVEHSQPVQSGYRAPSAAAPVSRSQPSYQAAPRMEQRSSPPPSAPAVHSTPPASPAAAAAKK